MKQLKIIEDDVTDAFLNMFVSLGDTFSKTDLNTVSKFVCQMYAQNKTTDVNEARYLKLMEMSRNIRKVITIQICIAYLKETKTICILCR